jgi:hypothetical protein
VATSTTRCPVQRYWANYVDRPPSSSHTVIQGRCDQGHPDGVVLGAHSGAGGALGRMCGMREPVVTFRGVARLPTGTVTFLFTDIEGSTRRWEEQPDAMGRALARHDQILDEAISRFGGVVFSRMGDGVAAAFASPVAGLEAALVAQRALAAAAWTRPGRFGFGWVFTPAKVWWATASI